MRKQSAGKATQRGMSVIELLVGVAVGLIVLAGAVKLMSDTLGSNRRLLLETRVNQDLRAAADLIVRDLRRAGYWNNAVSGMFSTTGSTAPAPNPHRQIDLASNVIKYSLALDSDDTVGATEWAGYRLNEGVLEFLGSRDDAGDTEQWQPLTDPKVVRVTTLTISPLATPRVVELYTYCACLTRLTCTAADFQTSGPYESTRPRMTIRQFDIVVAGEAVHDPAVRREIRQSVRVRNDRLDGNCPTV
jgi:type IV pilus assembly protein PilW